MQKYRTDGPIRYGKDLKNEEPRSAKVIVVNDSFTLILAAIAGALGTAFIIIPIAIYCRRTAKRWLTFKMSSFILCLRWRSKVAICSLHAEKIDVLVRNLLFKKYQKYVIISTYVVSTSYYLVTSDKTRLGQAKFVPLWSKYCVFTFHALEEQWMKIIFWLN